MRLLGKSEYTVHRGAFFQFPFRWIYYYGSNKSTGKESGKTHLCALCRRILWTAADLKTVNAMQNIEAFSKPMKQKVVDFRADNIIFISGIYKKEDLLFF